MGHSNQYLLSEDFECHDLVDTLHISSLGFTAKGYVTLVDDEASTVKIQLNPFELVLPLG